MPKKKDLTGQKFGRLTVLQDSGERNKSGNVLWLCQCNCGKQCKIIGSNLLKGKTTSCGCYGKKEAPKKNIKNLTGQRFGKLLVLEDSGQRTKYRNVIWKCRCDCGEITFVSGGDLNTHTKSCGKCQCSHGELLIKEILEKSNINFITQKTFEDCINPLTNMKLRFDFYLPDYNCCIEFDGIQHFKETYYFKDNLKTIQYRDDIKNNYCKENNIDLIRIPYYNINNITIKDLIKE